MYGECDRLNMHAGMGQAVSKGLQKGRDALMKLAKTEQAAPGQPATAIKGFARSARTAQQRADVAGYGPARKALVALARKEKRR